MDIQHVRTNITQKGASPRHSCLDVQYVLRGVATEPAILWLPPLYTSTSTVLRSSLSLSFLALGSEWNMRHLRSAQLIFQHGENRSPESQDTLGPFECVLRLSMSVKAADE